MEITIMNLVVDSGSARSFAMEAIYAAKKGDFQKAEQSLLQAEESISKAHEAQTSLIQRESKGEAIPVSLFLIHGQDHLMNAAVVMELAREMVELYQVVLK